MRFLILDFSSIVKIKEIENELGSMINSGWELSDTWQMEYSIVFFLTSHLTDPDN